MNLDIVDDLAIDATKTIASFQTLRRIVAGIDAVSLGLEKSPDLQASLPLIEVVSDQLAMDLFACKDCLFKAKADIRKKVEEAEEERTMYTKALDCIASGHFARLEEEISALEAEEQQLREKLALYDCEEEKLQIAHEKIRREEERFMKDEKDFWLNVADYQLDLDESQDEGAQILSATRYKTTALDRLKHSNVLNDMFRIAQDGPFVTINSFRMGRLPEHQVAWEEINAAWGQACLLLDALIKRHQLPVTQCILQPRGSYSAIKVGGDVFQLHSSSELSVYSSSEQQYRFDRAMVSFLGCVKEVAGVLSWESKLPFQIEDCKVSGFSIRTQLNQDNRWTKALKYMLLDLKVLIGFLESRSP